MSDCKELARQYVSAFCTGDLAQMSMLLADDFVIQGPLYRFESARDFLERLGALNAPPADHDLVSLQGDDNHASVFFHYRLGPMDLLMAMHFSAHEGRLHRALLVFDTAKLPKR